MISLRLPPELEEKLVEISHIEKKTKTDILKESLLLYIKSKEIDTSPYELASKYFGHSISNQTEGSIKHSEIIRKKIKKKYNA